MYKRTFLLLIIFTVGIYQINYAQINFGFGGTFQYLKGNETNTIGDNWINSNYNDSGWKTGSAPFRYGDGSGGVNLTDMQGQYSTIYLRSTFSAQQVDNIYTLQFLVNYDDGFVIWINGHKALAINAPDDLSNTALALANHESGSELTFDVDAKELGLVEGANSIAIMGLNVTLTSSDFYFDIKLSAKAELPPAPAFAYESDVQFSHKAGFYENPFDLVLTAPKTEYHILYTIDGSDPRTSSAAKLLASPVKIHIDPESTNGRGKTPATLVRASLVSEGFAPSVSLTQTYIFLNAVSNQKEPGGDWPSSSVNKQLIDYEMADDVVRNSAYTYLLEPALQQIPSLSVVTDLKNLFDSGIGIYVNAEQKGIDWERPCSVELINADKSEGFQVNAGLRIRGGNSAKNKNNPKHAFRLYFREEYGKSKLEFPLFDSEGATEFDCIDLRCEQNYSWSMDGSFHNTLVKDIFCRDLQGKMGQPYKRGRYYHLYLNGMYWGIYQTDERAEADYAQSYFGGDEEDYDVVKVNTQPWPYYCEATDGNMDAWNELWNKCKTGFTSNANYFALEGKKADGTIDPDGKVWVDIDNLIDYMMIIFYSGNFDAPVSAWSGNDMPNNFFAIYNRENKSKGFQFLVHDSEHSLFVESVFGFSGINENRVNIGANGSMKIDNVLDFNPQWLHYKLSSNAEYRLRFADKAHCYLNQGGLLSPEITSELFKTRAGQIDKAIIAESARWGDAQTNSSLTKNNDWLPELQTMYDKYFPYRTNIVVQQLKQQGLYPEIATPEIYLGNVLIQEYTTLFNGSKNVTIGKESTLGLVYYTLNGSDPRNIGGRISTDAIAVNNQAVFTISETSLILARIYVNGNWGPLKRVVLVNENEDYSNFKVTELHYHPKDVVNGQDTISGQDYEFVEFKNIGDHLIDLSGMKIDSAIEYQFPDECLLLPGHFYVLASKPNRFYEKYGSYPSGNFAKNLSNSGEFFMMVDRNRQNVLSFTYDDKLPWPEEPDGEGYSLCSVEENPTSDPNLYTYWKTSSRIDGTPFTNDDGTAATIVLHEELKTLVYPNPTSGFITIANFTNVGDQQFDISLYNMNGRFIFAQKSETGREINLKALGINPGIYLLRIKFEQSTITQKVAYQP